MKNLPLTIPMQRGIVAVGVVSVFEPPVQLDHFARFGLARSFDLDEQQLTARYYALQRSTHPDRAIKLTSEGTEEEAQEVLQQSAAINQAYRTLKDPLQRAEHLLSLYQKRPSSEQQAPHDPAFLIEQLALREALANADDHNTLREVTARITALYAGHYQQLTLALAQAAWEDAADRLDKLKFLAKCHQQALQLEIALLAN